VAVAADPGLVPERLPDRLTDADRGVLDGVVGVDVQIALGADREVDERVAAERRAHVVVGAGRRADLVCAGAVEVDLDDDVRLGGLPLDPGGPGSGPRGGEALSHRGSTSCRALRNACISSGVPIDTRIQPGGPTSRIRTP